MKPNTLRKLAHCSLFPLYRFAHIILPSFSLQQTFRLLVSEPAPSVSLAYAVGRAPAAIVCKATEAVTSALATPTDEERMAKALSHMLGWLILPGLPSVRLCVLGLLEGLANAGKLKVQVSVANGGVVKVG